MDRVFSFLLWPKREARGPWKQGRKKRGSITCPTDWANEANKMFIIWLCWLFRFWNGDRELEVYTATYGPGIDQSQHAKSVSHIIIYLISYISFISYIYIFSFTSKTFCKWDILWHRKTCNSPMLFYHQDLRMFLTQPIHTLNLRQMWASTFL